VEQVHGELLATPDVQVELRQAIAGVEQVRLAELGWHAVVEPGPYCGHLCGHVVAGDVGYFVEDFHGAVPVTGGQSHPREAERCPDVRVIRAPYGVVVAGGEGVPAGEFGARGDGQLGRASPGRRS
jgi:hypothetical protein